VRHEIPVAGTSAHVFARWVDEEGGTGTTVVVVLPQAAASPDPDVLRREFGLTPRETEVALMLAARRSNKEIASQLSIAHKTAWRHTERVMSKLNTGSRREVRRVLESAGCA
jgi:DNA-binding CsgD family transcriptional regulator